MTVEGRVSVELGSCLKRIPKWQKEVTTEIHGIINDFLYGDSCFVHHFNHAAPTDYGCQK